MSGRSSEELPATLRARELWERIGAQVPGVGFRACGSLTLLRGEAEVAVAKRAASAPDAAARGFELLDPGEARRRNPALRGDFLAALWCARDAAVESRVALPALRAGLLRYYPAFHGPELDALRAAEPQAPVAAEHHMQLLCVQREHGGLTIGDTHAYDEPFPFDLDEAPYTHLTEVVERFLGRALPPVTRRWAGVYAQCADPARIVHRAQPDPAVWLVNGPGGRGMTLSPAIAEDTANEAGL